MTALSSSGQIRSCSKGDKSRVSTIRNNSSGVGGTYYTEKYIPNVERALPDQPSSSTGLPQLLGTALEAGNWKCVFKRIWAKRKDISNMIPGASAQNVLVGLPYNKDHSP